MAGYIYENCFKIMDDVRHGVNEHSDTLVAGTNTSGKYQNDYLMGRINMAQRMIYAPIFKRQPDLFLQSRTALSFVSSVASLPWDHGRTLQIEQTEGYKVWPDSAKYLPVSGGEGSEYRYYRRGSNVVLTKAGVTATYYIWYYRKPRDLTYGLSGTGAATSIVLADATHTKRLNDYYNGMLVEDYTQGFANEVTDYTASTRACVITGTSVTSDGYGFVSELPEPFHFLIAPLAVILTKAQHPASQEKPTVEEQNLWKTMFNDTMVTFLGSDDEDAVDIWADFGGPVAGSGVNIPGQGYLIPG